MIAIKFGEVLREWRERRSLSYRALAKRASCDHSYLWELENGKKRPSYDVAKSLDDALASDGQILLASRPDTSQDHKNGEVSLPSGSWTRTDAEELAEILASGPINADSAARLAHDWMITDSPQVYEMKSGRRIGAKTVEKIRNRAQRLRKLDDQVGGRETSSIVTKELGDTIDLLKQGSYSELTGRSLLSIVSELCQVAGWVSSDAGQYSQAVRFYLAGAHAGHAANDSAAGANCLSSLSYQLSNLDPSPNAIRLARTSAQGARNVSPKTRALFAERVAWAHSRAGEVYECERALQAADDFFTSSEDTSPEWLYWLDRREVDIMAGRCWTELKRPLRAIPLLEKSLDGYSDGLARENALYRSWLAEAYLQAHEVEEAARNGILALQLTSRASSSRSESRMDRLLALFEPHTKNAYVQDFKDLHENI